MSACPGNLIPRTTQAAAADFSSWSAPEVGQGGQGPPFPFRLPTGDPDRSLLCRFSFSCSPPDPPHDPLPRPSVRHSRPCHPSSSSQLTVLAGDLVTGQQQMPTAKICTLGPLGRREHSRSERRCEVWCVRSGTAVSTASAADSAKEEIRARLKGSACSDGQEQLGTHWKRLSIV